MSLQYLRKEVRDGVCILHADKHRSFYKLALLSLMEVARHVQSTKNRKLVMFLQYFQRLVMFLQYFQRKVATVLLQCKTFRYFSGVQSCLLLLVSKVFFLCIRNTYFQEHQSFFPWLQCIKQEFTFLFLGFFKKLDVLY